MQMTIALPLWWCQPYKAHWFCKSKYTVSLKLIKHSIPNSKIQSKLTNQMLPLQNLFTIRWIFVISYSSLFVCSFFCTRVRSSSSSSATLFVFSFSLLLRNLLFFFSLLGIIFCTVPVKLTEFSGLINVPTVQKTNHRRVRAYCRCTAGTEYKHLLWDCNFQYSTHHTNIF